MKFVIAGAVCAVVAFLPTLPAVADTTGGTNATFHLTGGALSITVPDSADLGTSATGAETVSGSLGAVQVTDNRGAVVATWTATAASSAFTSDDAQTIPAADVYYWSGVATSTAGVGVFTPGQAVAAAEVAIDTAGTAYSLTAGVGNNHASWSPTIDVHLPASAPAGDYTGTVTHSVS